MASGLTCDIGKGQAFEEFVWRCARHMGALIHMRDHDPDAPISMPAPDSYHAKSLMDAKARLARFKGMSETQAELEAEAVHAAALESLRQAEESRKRLRLVYEAMLAKVEAWEPPTADHEGLKSLMREQIRETINYDCESHDWPPPKKKSGAAWLKDRIAAAKDDISYHSKKLRENTANALSRRQWVEALAESVPIPAALRPSKH